MIGLKQFDHDALAYSLHSKQYVVDATSSAGTR